MFLRRHFTLWTLGLFALLSSLFYTQVSFAITGDGSPMTPYTIATCADLLLLDGVTYDEDAFYQLANDIDCTGETAVFPLFDGSEFTGVFHGHDYSISGLAESHASSNIAMFTSASDATIQRFTLEGSLASTQNNVSGLIYQDNGGNNVNNITVSLDITGGAYMIAGVVGDIPENLDPSTYYRVDYDGSITTTDSESPLQNVAGFVASVSTTNFTECTVNVLFVVAEHDNILDLGGFAGNAYDSVFETNTVTAELSFLHSPSILSNIGGFAATVEATVMNDGDVLFTLENGDDASGEIYNIGGLVGLSTQEFSSDNNNIEVYMDLYANNINMLGGFSGYLCADGEELVCELDTHSNATLSGTFSLTADADIYNVGGFAGVSEFTDINTSDVTINMTSHSINANMLSGFVGYMNEGILNSNSYIGTMDIETTDAGDFYNIGGLVGSAEFDFLSATPEFEVTDNSAESTLVIGNSSFHASEINHIGGMLGYAPGGTISGNKTETIMVLYADDSIYNIGGFAGAIEGDALDTVIDQNYFYGEVIVSSDSTATIQFVAGFIGALTKSFISSSELTLTNSFSSGLIFAPNNIAAFIGTLDGFTVADVSNLYTDIRMLAFDGEEYSGFIMSANDVPTIENVFTAASFDTDDANTPAFIRYNDGVDLVNAYYNDDSMQDTQCGDEFTLDEDFTSCIAYNVDGTEDDLLTNTDAEDPFSTWDFTTVWEAYPDSHPLLRAYPDIYNDGVNDPDNLDYNFDQGDLMNSLDFELSFDIEHYSRLKQFHYVLAFYLDDTEEDPVLIYESPLVTTGSYTYTFGDDAGTYTVGDPEAMEDGEYHISLYLVDLYDEESNSIFFGEDEGNPLFTLDATAPILTELTPVDATLSEDSLVYGLTTTEGGDLHVSACGPTITAEAINTEDPFYVTFADLVEGETYTCEIYITDEANNDSNTLIVGPFTYLAPMEEEESSGGSGGGGKSRPSTSRTKDTESTTSEASTTATPTPTMSEYEQEIAKAFEEGIITKEPTKEANKCEALVMISRVFEWPLIHVNEAPFKDIPEWCYDVAAYAKTQGFVQGRSEGLLGMESPINRYEFVVMFVRVLEISAENLLNQVMSPHHFKDDIVSWATKYVIIAENLDIIQGFEDGTFGGEKALLKQDLAVMLLRFMEL